MTSLLRCLVSLAVMSPIAASSAEINIENPRATIIIPDLEDVELGPHPNALMNPQAKLLGRAKTGETISVLAPTSDKFSPLRCAAWLTGDVLSRFVPSMDTVQLVKLGDNAYVALFPFSVPGGEQLKAFVASGNGKGHCIQVHISRSSPTDQQREAWFKGFREIRVRME